MKPVDCRNETWKDVMGRVNLEMDRVYQVVRVFGPATTKYLATTSGMSLLTLRPRVSDLVTLGLVEMVGDVRGREGIYRAVPLDVAEQRFQEAKSGVVQPELRLV